MSYHTPRTIGKAPGACNTEGLKTDTTNHPHCVTAALASKAVATQIAELALRGHAVHQMADGAYVVCKYGYSYEAPDFADLQAFARRLGVSQ